MSHVKTWCHLLYIKVSPISLVDEEALHKTVADKVDEDEGAVHVPTGGWDACWAGHLTNKMTTSTILQNLKSLQTASAQPCPHSMHSFWSSPPLCLPPRRTPPPCLTTTSRLSASTPISIWRVTSFWRTSTCTFCVTEPVGHSGVLTGCCKKEKKIHCFRIMTSGDTFDVKNFISRIGEATGMTVEEIKTPSDDKTLTKRCFSFKTLTPLEMRSETLLFLSTLIDTITID